MLQQEALDVLKTSANVFLTGEPGSGKTYTLNQYITYLREHSIPVAVTASTGIAATHIGGMTIHAWSGIGIKDSLSAYDVEQIATREHVVKRINAAKVLVIDEISMLDARILGMVDRVLRAVKRNEEAFGGIQVVLVGDFFQLPPIGKNNEARFAFASPVWRDLGLMICYLEEQHRQSDSTLLGLLGSLRRGAIDESVYDVIKSCMERDYGTTEEDGDGIPMPGNFGSGRAQIEPTRLYTHNADVDRENDAHLAAIGGEKRTFTMESRGARALVEGLRKSCLSPENLELKAGAMVMCTKNNFDVGYVNGTTGTVAGYEEKTGYPVVKTVDGRQLVISPASWSIMENDAVIAEVTQIPLRLAWAITVHKSQGMSLDAAEIDLSHAFEYGQGYVALSRVRSLAGLLLRGCNERALEVHPEVRAYDRTFREESDHVSKVFGSMSEAEKKEMRERFILANGGTLERIAVEPKALHAKEKISTYEKTKALLREGKTIEEIAHTRGMTEETIVNHISRLAEEGAISAEDIKHLDFDQKRLDAVLAAVEKVGGSEKLAPIYYKLKEAYSYNDIRLLLAINLVINR